ncbi:MAG TPA: EthD family reductase [Aurantimonas sp.]|nr:EthD family reductase [Aurantimonas sp.]
MAKLIVLYKHPNDPASFDDYYFRTHAPLAKKIPGLIRYEVSDGAVAGPGGPTGYHLVASLEFASRADVEAGLATPEGQAAAADLGNFADGGVELLMFDTKMV